MTNDEAVNVLKNTTLNLGRVNGKMALAEAVNMAITALQTDGDNKTPCDLCMYNPPSSGDGKPCCMCPAERRTDGVDC